MYIFKKLIPLFLLFTILIGCSAKIYTPVINTEFEINAVYKTGDFSYSCKIVKTSECLFLTPTSTNAAGMTIKFDGKTVTFKKDNMEKAFSRRDIDSTNPAVILYEVFTALESDEINAQKNADVYEYTGNTSIGKFMLTQRRDNSYKTLKIPQADIEIEFD